MTLRIPLSQGLSAVIDEQDLPLVSGFTWCAKRARCRTVIFYAMSRQNRRTIYMHRIITKAAPGQLVDHRDHDGLNNTRNNLRLTDHAGNGTNKRLTPPKSGYRGVSLEGSTYRAAVYRKGKPIYLGHFQTAKLAAIAFDRAASELYGEMAVLNFPGDEH